jgi:hypothetical protein
MKRQLSFLYRNSLSSVLTLLFVIFIAGRTFTGWQEHNDELNEFGTKCISLSEHLSSGHFIQATFENWQSEFIAVISIVVLSIFSARKDLRSLSLLMHLTTKLAARDRKLSMLILGFKGQIRTRAELKRALLSAPRPFVKKIRDESV